MSDAKLSPTLTPEAQDFLASVTAKNRALYGGFKMEANDGGDGDDGDKGQGDGDKGDNSKDDGDDGKGDAPKPTDTVEYWKKRSRENERRAKDNAEDAKEYAKLREAQKTEDERRRDAETKQNQEREALRLDNLRLRAAGTHGVSGEDSDGVAYADLISGADEESVTRSAEAIGRLVATASQVEKLQEELDEIKKGRPAGERPGTGNLRSGATPPGDSGAASGSGGIAEADRRFGSKKQNAS